jgi:hypothetical protein
MANGGGKDWIAAGIAALGSLKLTVALLAMSIFLVFAGTVAQIDAGIWTVVDKYFRTAITLIPVRVFFPRAWDVPGQIPFPGGWLIGAALVVNLLVSHAVRIRLEARGGRLGVGLAILAIGTLLTWLVVGSGFDADSAQAKASPTWRVTAQLLQATEAAVVLFLGCRILFGRKAGIVLLHAGIVVMMSSEIITGLAAREGQMTIDEGQTVSFVEDNRSVELAFVDRSDPARDDVVVVPKSRLVRPGPVEAPELPVDVEVLKPGLLINADLVRPSRDKANPATAGAGLSWIAEPRQEESGASSDQRVDLPAVYVRLREKGTGRDLGTYLAAVLLTLSADPQPVRVGDRTWTLSLRFPRTYKPYEVTLRDFQFAFYPGTKTPKDFSAYVHIHDRERGTEREARIWMNNPLRYHGDTLYQASWDGDAGTTTTLQVVTNAGWMLPYVACMIVATGMFGQFWLSFAAMLARRKETA